VGQEGGQATHPERAIGVVEVDFEAHSLVSESGCILGICFGSTHIKAHIAEGVGPHQAQLSSKALVVGRGWCGIGHFEDHGNAAGESGGAATSDILFVLSTGLAEMDVGVN
jgi:hypothetical protein